MKQASITGWGTYVPEKILTNADLEKMVDTSSEWIIQRTGIEKRYIAAPQEFSSDLAIKAVQDLQKKYNKSVSDVDFIIVASSTPDFFFPSLAAQVQHGLEIRSAGAIDVSAACAGWTYGLILANSLINSGAFKKILVIGAEVLSKTIDYADRAVCILFGDGAAATLVEAIEGESDFLGTHCGSDGSFGSILYRNAVSTKMNNHPIIADHKVHQDGLKVFKWAVTNIQKSILALLEKSNYSLDKIDWFVPHSANLRMIEAICQGLEFPIERTLVSVCNYGNTSTASIPLAIVEGIKAKAFKKGDIVLVYGFGGGLVHAGCIIKWNI
ncbi:MAG TPA: ketoacyl-ACP synthase III [Bacteroidia bacterium]|jgi:3-oxoacyl-[acyl-carrier-protein] synthase-3|nr:ketoacyl-ACP synthase III [Bacteroidia bacterium]